MKITYRIPSKDPFGFVEIELEMDDKQGFVGREIIDQLEEMMAYHKGETVPGLPPKDFNAWIDNYLLTGTGNADLHAQMNPEQQGIIKAIQLSRKRIKNKTGEPEIE